MSGFNIDNSVNTSAGKPLLEGFKIHDVEFKGADKEDFKNGEFKVIVCKFENEHGQFRHTIFEPRPEDYKRTASQYGENPSRVEIILDSFKQLTAAVNPTFYKETIESGKGIKANTWENLRDLFVTATKPGIGTKLQIKLDKNGKGEAQFPGFPLAIGKEANVYRTTTYIGEGLGFTPKEVKRINAYVQATPTNMKKQATNDGLGDLESMPPKSSSEDLDLEGVGDL